jgi:predicted glycosyltransferase
MFKHAIEDLERQGHETLVTAREKDVTTRLLSAYGIDHEVLSEKRDSAIGLPAEWLARGVRLVRSIRAFGPDVVLSHFNPVAAQAARLTGTPSIIFTDDEVATRTLRRVTTPFARSICTPSSFELDLGSKHRRYDGLHELAYLHPDRFDPDPDRLRSHGVPVEDPYYVLRFVSWSAHHDVGESGFSREGKRRLVAALAQRGEVYVSSEEPLPDAFEARAVPVPPEAIHDLLYHADCYAGDSQTMAIEAGILGTPAVRSNSFVEDGEMGHLNLLEDRYGLVNSIADERAAIDRIEELADDPRTDEIWSERREELLDDSVDVTDVILEEAFSAGP